jgi:hypothetical protein
LAETLLELGDDPKGNWQIMLDSARQVLRDVPPVPYSYNEFGKQDPAKVSPSFRQWAKAHRMSENAAQSVATMEEPMTILAIGSHGNRESIPILESALKSPNNYVKAMAARGLAEMHSEASVGQIIRACQESPRDAAEAIARSLALFDTSQAQAAAEKYLSKERTEEIRQAERMQRKPVPAGSAN